MRVAFLYNEFTEDPAWDPAAHVTPGMPVAEALERLGHDVVRIPCTLDLAAVRSALEACAPAVAFNHVESLGGSDLMMVAIALLLDAMRIPYTGCTTEGLVAAAGKVLTKDRLLEGDLPTPPWVTSQGGPRGRGPEMPGRVIVKAVYEHASFHMGDDAVVACSSIEDAVEAVCRRESEFARPFLAEQFIAGREFNLALLAGDDGEPVSLPPAEIIFRDFPPGKPHIVGFKAKWAEGSFEYDHTPRRFDMPASDRTLVERLREMARAAWRLFGVTGYARVDFRVDERGAPWVLEVNANPCLAPDAGFAAALTQAGIGYDDAIQAMVDDAVRRRSFGRVALPAGGA